MSSFCSHNTKNAATRITQTLLRHIQSASVKTRAITIPGTISLDRDTRTSLGRIGLKFSRLRLEYAGLTPPARVGEALEERDLQR